MAWFLYICVITKKVIETIIMGKGDKKTKKGKTFAGSYGKTRKRKSAATVVVTAKPKKAAPAKEKEVEKPVEKKVAEKKPVAKKAPAKKPAAKK